MLTLVRNLITSHTTGREGDRWHMRERDEAERGRQGSEALQRGATSVPQQKIGLREK